MKLLVDMNLSPTWVETLQQAGWQSSHWSSLGNPRSPDAEIMRFAREFDWIVFTHDLDFGAILAHTNAGKPSVFQVRARDLTPHHSGPVVIQTLRQFADELCAGALVTLDEARQRVRLLPITA
jgi:predicted nuclease of predicted toxin-antitoxin system